MTSEQRTFDDVEDEQSPKLRDVTTHIVDSEHKSAPEVEDGYPYVKTSDIENGRILFDDISYVDEDTYGEWTRRLKPEPGDLILTREAPVGRVGLIPDGREVCLGQRTVLIRPDANILDNQYLRYLLLSDDIQHRLDSLSTGSTVDHLNLEDLRSFELPSLPDLESQRKIGEILSNFDEKIELNKDISGLLEDIVQALFERRFVDFDSYDTFKNSSIGKIPKEFEVLQMGDICSTRGGGTPSTDEDEYWGEEYRWLTPKEVTSLDTKIVFDTERKITEEGLNNSSTAIMPEKSVLLTSRATVGEVVVNREPMGTNQGFICIQPNDRVSPYYLSCVVENKRAEIESRASGSTYDEISQTSFNEIQVAVPPKEDIDKFESRVEDLYNEIYTRELENKKLNSLRDTLLPKLMSGEVRVNDINLDDLEVGSEV